MTVDHSLRFAEVKRAARFINIALALGIIVLCGCFVERHWLQASTL